MQLVQNNTEIPKPTSLRNSKEKKNKKTLPARELGKTKVASYLDNESVQMYNELHTRAHCSTHSEWTYMLNVDLHNHVHSLTRGWFKRLGHPIHHAQLPSQLHNVSLHLSCKNYC